MNVLAERVHITSPSQVEVGEYYEVRGTDAYGTPIPPQVIKVKTPPIINNLALGVPTMTVDIMIQVGNDRIVVRDAHFDFWTVNIKSGKGITTGHGHHDRELVKITSESHLKRILGPNNYKQMVAEASAQQTGVIAAYGRKYGSYR